MMTEENFAAFTRISQHVINDDGIDSNDDLITIAKGLGATDEEIKEQFPEFFDTDEEEEEEEENDQVEEETEEPKEE